MKKVRTALMLCAAAALAAAAVYVLSQDGHRGDAGSMAQGEIEQGPRANDPIARGRAAHDPMARLEAEQRVLSARLAALEARIEQVAVIASGGGDFAWADAQGSSAVQESMAAGSAPDSDGLRVHEAQLRESQAIVERVLSTGVWRREDAEALTIATAGLPRELHDEIYRRLVVAINEDRLRPEPGALLH